MRKCNEERFEIYLVSLGSLVVLVGVGLGSM